MTYDQVRKHFGGLTKAATALEISRQTVFSWKTRHTVPGNWQIRIEAKTDGKLKASKTARRDAEALAALLKPRPERVSENA